MGLPVFAAWIEEEKPLFKTHIVAVLWAIRLMATKEKIPPSACLFWRDIPNWLFILFLLI